MTSLDYLLHTVADSIPDDCHYHGRPMLNHLRGMGLGLVSYSPYLSIDIPQPFCDDIRPQFLPLPIGPFSLNRYTATGIILLLLPHLLPCLPTKRLLLFSAIPYVTDFCLACLYSTWAFYCILPSACLTDKFCLHTSPTLSLGIATW